METFSYTVKDKTFYQKPLVLGQVKQLVASLKGMALPYNLNAEGLVLALGDKLSETFSVILVEKDVPLKNKNLDEIQEYLEENLDLETSIRIVKDFFDCNPIVSISEELIGLSMKVKSTMKQANSLTESASSLPVETSQSEMTSSGDTPLENANPT